MIELPDAAQMREADRRTIAAGTPGIELMRRAGAAVARCAAAGRAGRILILCGPGNNGGDGFVAAGLLAERGYEVVLELLGDVSAVRGDAALAAASWPGPVGKLGASDPAAADLIVDALFGTGLVRDLNGHLAAVIERANASGRPILAVDIPSGIDADSGQVRGAAIHAERTVTFARPKPGLMLYPGRRYAGEVTVADIGIVNETFATLGCRTFVNDPALWMEMFPRPQTEGHKYDRGHALVVSGPASRTGAARLAARGALRAGAGLVTVAAGSAAMPVNAAHLTAIMLRVAEGAAGLAGLLADSRFNALVLGPGLGVGAETREAVGVALAADRATVLDADALTSFAGEASALAGLAGMERRSSLVLTPHDGEFARLFGNTVPDASKLERARAAAAASGAVLVLKGPDTVIASPGGRASVNANGTPYLATAGSGDVLCGFVAALLAQGMPGFEAAAAGVWLHAEAGRRFGPGLIAEDLPDLLPAVLRELLDELRRT